MPPKQSHSTPNTPQKRSPPHQNGTAHKPPSKPSPKKPDETSREVADAEEKRRFEAESARLDRERQQQSSAAAKKALELQKQAHDLTQAALATGDADERQKLLTEALNKLVESGSLGKVAKYLTTGTCQGMLTGGGIGTTIGIGLGGVVGILVGGVSSLVLGGLGTGIGALVGVLHGPWFKPGEVLASGIGKVTGAFLPDWEATPEQKYRLEKMIGQANEMDRPTTEELEALTAGDQEGWLGDIERGQGPEWSKSATWFPGKGYVTGWMKGDDGKAKAVIKNEKGEKKDVQLTRGEVQHALLKKDLKDASPGGTKKPKSSSGDEAGKADGSANGTSGRSEKGKRATAGSTTGTEQQKPARGKPAKLEVRSQRNGGSVQK